MWARVGTSVRSNSIAIGYFSAYSTLVKTMVTSESSQPQQQVAVVALVGILAFVFLVGGFLLYRVRSSSYGQKTEEAQVRNLH